jgi:selenocysteine lyase/cysteine desulfurase
MFLSLAARRGVRIERADDAPEGGVDPASVRTLVRRHRPRLVSITWVPTNGGLVQPAAEVGAVCEAEGVPFLLDACQAVGQLAIDVAALRCDFLSATARKFLRGPRGIGFLYASDAVLARGAYPLLVDMRGAMWSAENAFTLFPGARRFEEWEFPYALVLGLGAAARYALEAGIARTAARAHTLAAAARRQIGAIPGVRSLDREARLSAIAAFAFESHVAHDVMHALRARAINTSALARSDAVIDMSRKGAETALRVSPHYFNTGVEIDGLEAALKEVISG